MSGYRQTCVAARYRQIIATPAAIATHAAHTTAMTRSFPDSPGSEFQIHQPTQTAPTAAHANAARPTQSPAGCIE